MAKNFITFEHPRTGITRDVPVGFNWQLLQFGALLPIYQREWLLSLVVVVGGLATFSVSNVALAFFYNKLRVRSLVKDGFLARGTEEGSITQIEARLGMALPRHLPADEPPGYELLHPIDPKYELKYKKIPREDRTSTVSSTCPPDKPAQTIDSRAGTTLSVTEHGTVQNRLLYPLQRHD